MIILGNGLVARAFLPMQEQHENVLIFASGVSDSRTTDPAQYQREITVLYDALHRCKELGQLIVYFSSGGAIYGDTRLPRSEDSPTFPKTLYGQHQLFCEAVIRNSGARYLIIRLPNLVGAGQNTAQLIPALIQQAQNGEARLFAQASRDIIDIEDFAHLTLRLLDRGVENETVIIASGISSPVTGLFDCIQRALGTDLQPELVDQGDIQRFDISKLRRLLGSPVHFAEEYPAGIIRKYAPGYIRQARKTDDAL